MRRPILAALLVSLVLPASAQADFFPAELIDGPTPDLISVEDVAVSRDGDGGAVYLRRDGGVPHVFYTALWDGAFLPPVRLDQGMAAAATDAVISAATQGRMVIAYTVGGTLFTQARTKGAEGFSAPTPLAGNASNPSIDISVNGAAYVTFEQNGNVLAARAERDSTQFNLIPTPLDVNPPSLAGETERKAPKVEVSADGSALVVWGEDGTDGRTHVFARRLFEQRLSVAPQDLTVNEVGGVPAGAADTPRLDMEDDSSFAQVVFRQMTAGGPRLLMRRLVGSEFDPPVAVDGGLAGDSGDIDLTGRGEGLWGVSAAGGEVVGGIVFDNKVVGQTRLDPGNAVPPRTTASLGENEDGVVAWMQGTATDATVHARFFDGVEALKLSSDATLSNPAFGPVVPDGGLVAGASRAGDTAVLFLQGGAADRRLVAGFFDKPPSRVGGANTENVKRLTRLEWGDTINLFGGTKYTVVVDGKPIAETTESEYVPKRGDIRDGNHTWKVLITDRRGQQVSTRTRRLRVDNTPPTLRASFSRSGRTLTITARGRDSRGRLRSGFDRIMVDFGTGKYTRMGRRRSHTYSRGGTYTVRVKSVDKAGNERVQTRRIRVG